MEKINPSGLAFLKCRSNCHYGAFCCAQHRVRQASCHKRHEQFPDQPGKHAHPSCRSRVRPLAGAVVGALSDLIGCLLVGYSINPIITAGAVIIGLLAGLLRKFLPRGGSGMRSYLRFLLIVSAAHLTGSVIIKTLGLYFYFGSPLLFTFAVRLGIYAVTAIIESVILYILYTRKIIAKFKPQPARRQKENDQNEL